VRFIIRIAAATELGLIIAESAIPGASSFLPLGGSHVAQLGFIFGPLLVAHETTSATKEAMKGWRKRRRLRGRFGFLRLGKDL
jgi:hypothetical protein